MKKHIKKAIKTLIIIIIMIVAVISSFFIVKNIKNKEKIKTVKEIYSNEKVQDRLEDEDTGTKENNLLLQFDNESVVGVIKIEKINYEGLIYEGTSLDTLAKGVGHFENSPYFTGNVCLAAHNTNQFWAKLHTLQNGDEIIYTSFLGTKKYKVNNVTQIDETDWSNLSNTNENILTLITCVKGKREQRLCVQGIEKN